MSEEGRETEGSCRESKTDVADDEQEGEGQVGDEERVLIYAEAGLLGPGGVLARGGVGSRSGVRAGGRAIVCPLVVGPVRPVVALGLGSCEF